MKNSEFSALIERYQSFVFAVCFQLVGDKEEALDLTQETFLSAYRHIDTCRAENYRPWLARIAANKAKDFLRSAYQRRVTASGGEALEELPARGGPEELCDCADGVRRIREKIDQLGEPYTMAARMYFLEEKSIEEISTRLSRPKKTIQTQIYRAKQMLRQSLKEDGYGT